MNQSLNEVKKTVSQAEWQLRVDLAACYRLIAMHGWDDLVFTHVSARIPGPEHHFLINPYGFMFDEITASSLVKVDNNCQPVIPTTHKVNPAGFIIHSAIHYAREDAGCVLHTHTPAGIAVSTQRAGVLPISQQSTIVLNSLGYHDYEGIAVADDEKPRLVRDLGTNNYLMLRNHGLLTVGGSIAQAFLNMFTFERACQIQVLAQGQGADLVSVEAKVLAGVKANIKTVTAGMGDSLVWPALLRKLNRVNPGFDQ
jgi:ribulose-5-phosphate 4-epimerase/fuculose-1-phosphate aldolase